MGLKQFVNSNSGRVAMATSAMALTAILGAAAIMTWLIYYPMVQNTSLEGQLKSDSTSWGIHDVKIGLEKSPLAGLPSTTLSYIANDGTAESKPNLQSDPVGFPLFSLDKSSLEGLVNVSAATDKSATNTTGATDYSFKFYSGSLKDYTSGGAYENAASQFLIVNTVGLADVKFISKPTPSGVRDVTIDVRAGFNFDATRSNDGKALWESLVNQLTSSDSFGNRTVIHLTLHDSDAVSLTAILASKDDAKAAAQLYPGLWTTFAAYAYGDHLSFLKTSAVQYNIESTPEDSTLTVTVDKSAKSVADLKSRIIKTSVDSDGEIVVVWSYNTYFVTADSATPFLTLYSSSMNW